VWPKHVAPLSKPLLTPYCRKESCDFTVINKAYIVTSYPLTCIRNLRNLEIHAQKINSGAFALSFPLHLQTVNAGCDAVLQTT
jgi:hypothetical protein